MARRLVPISIVALGLLVGRALAGLFGLLNVEQFELQLAVAEWTTPSVSRAATISIGIALFIVAMAAQPAGYGRTARQWL